MEINENDWIKISERTFLRSINLADHTALYDLMKTIYLQAYRHLWVDGGKWYLDRIYGWDRSFNTCMAFGASVTGTKMWS